MKNKLFEALKDNRAISLMEVIVVVAIMSVLIGVTSLGFGMVSTKSANECAEKMDICLNRVRIQTMGKQKGFLAFYSDSEGNVYAIEKYDADYSGDIPVSGIGVSSVLSAAEMNSLKGTKIGKKGITVNVYSVTKTGDPETPENETLIMNLTDTANNPIYFEFNRSDGSIKNFDKNIRIKVEKNGKLWNVNLQKLTGKISVDK